jgi:hypothetical protein
VTNVHLEQHELYNVALPQRQHRGSYDKLGSFQPTHGFSWTEDEIQGEVTTWGPNTEYVIVAATARRHSEGDGDIDQVSRIHSR